MGTIIKTDTVEGARIVREGVWTKELVRCVIVKGLTAGSYALKDACEACGAAWQEHPSIPGLRLVGTEAEGLGPDHAIVRMRYVNTGPRIYSGGVRLEMVESDKDLYGNKVTLNCGGSASYGWIKLEKQTQIGTFIYLAPAERIDILRIEPSLLVPGGIDPTQVSVIYGGSVNSDYWLHGAPGQWLCDGILYNNDGLGDVAWNMQYSFAYKGAGWNPEVIFVDPETKEPRVDAADGIGRKIVTKYQPLSFGALNLL